MEEFQDIAVALLILVVEYFVIQLIILPRVKRLLDHRRQRQSPFALGSEAAHQPVRPLPGEEPMRFQPRSSTPGSEGGDETASSAADPFEYIAVWLVGGLVAFSPWILLGTTGASAEALIIGGGTVFVCGALWALFIDTNFHMKDPRLRRRLLLAAIVGLLGGWLTVPVLAMGLALALMAAVIVLVFYYLFTEAGRGSGSRKQQ